jgi:N-acetylneuraminate synthase/N,N'-diacetyllegionaminate synthase
MTRASIEIAGRRIGAGERPWVIAEAGVNHDGDPRLAERLVDAAAEAGADAVKFQTFHADRLALEDAPQADYQRERAAAGSQREMLRRLELPTEALAGLRDRARERDVVFLSSPFDIESVELLVALGVPVIKIGSGDLTNLFLLRAVAARGIPVLVSTGMATLDEVDAAVADLRAHGDPPVVLLHCVSVYPAGVDMIDLRAMATMEDRYRVPVGFSDHTLGIGAPVAAAALGAAVIEKHLTLDPSMPGPDHAASLDPESFARMVAAIREAHAALGTGARVPVAAEEAIRAVVRRSIVVARPVRAGRSLSMDDLTALRPEGGLSPLRLDEVLGRTAARDLAAGAMLRPQDVMPPLDSEPESASDPRR